MALGGMSGTGVTRGRERPHLRISGGAALEDDRPDVAPCYLHGAIALAALSGILCWVASSSWIAGWPLAFVSWAPLFVALHGRTPRQALLLGGARELVAVAVGLGWLPAVIRTFGELPWVVCWAIAFVIFAYGAGRGAAMAWLAARAEKNGWPRGLGLVLAASGTEAVYPLLFPWPAAVQVHRAPILMQLAELGGPVLVGIPLSMASVALAEIAWARMDGRRVDRARVLVALAGPAAMALFGAIRVRAVEHEIAAAPKVDVAIVQGNTPQSGAGATLGRTAAIHRDATVRLQAERAVDLVVWPETALHGALQPDMLQPTLHRLMAPADGHARIAAPIVTGVFVQRRAGLSNSALLFADDAVRGIYDKMHPLAFGEYIPFEGTFPALRRWIPNAGEITAGTKAEPLRLGEHVITPLICYEDILGRSTNDAVVEANPDLLVNLTNDAWFGDSSAAAAHLAFATFRAVEHRRYLVHAANSGISAFVDPTGKVTGETPLLQAATSVGTLRWMRASTLYERVGEVPWWCAAAIAFAMAFVPRGRGERRSAGALTIGAGDGIGPRDPPRHGADSMA